MYNSWLEEKSYKQIQLKNVPHTKLSYKFRKVVMQDTSQRLYFHGNIVFET